jgi:hypothetical protein
MRVDKDLFMTQGRLIALGASLVLIGVLLLSTAARGVDVRLDGRIQWIAAEKMMLLLDSRGVPVSVDLTRVPQEQYLAVPQGTRIVVEGTFSEDGRRVIAASITSVVGREERPEAGGAQGIALEKT